MKKLLLLLAVALVAVVALAQSDSPTIEDTIATLQDGVTNIPLEAAIANIEGWRATLESSDDVAQQIVGSQLGDLATALQTDPIVPREVGSLLISLGKSSVLLGEDAGNDQVVSLGDLLTQAGTSLSVEDADGGANSGGM